MKQPPIVLAMCKTCERLFFRPRGKRIVYCSKECRRKADNYQRKRRRMFPELYPKQIKCTVCGKVFEKKHNQKYCSKDCKIIGEREVRRMKKKRYKKFLSSEPKISLVFADEIDWAKKEENRIQKMISKWIIMKQIEEFNKMQCSLSNVLYPKVISRNKLQVKGE